jgi:DNA-binding transcriptional regulator YiaG
MAMVNYPRSGSGSRPSREEESRVHPVAEEPISALIRRARVRHGMTQAALARQLATVSGNAAVTRDQITRWERGGRVPSPYWRHWLSVVLEVSSYDLDRAARCARAVRLLAIDGMAIDGVSRSGLPTRL